MINRIAYPEDDEEKEFNEMLRLSNEIQIRLIEVAVRNSLNNVSQELHTEDKDPMNVLFAYCQVLERPDRQIHLSYYHLESHIIPALKRITEIPKIEDKYHTSLVRLFYKILRHIKDYKNYHMFKELYMVVHALGLLYDWSTETINLPNAKKSLKEFLEDLIESKDAVKIIADDVDKFTYSDTIDLIKKYNVKDQFAIVKIFSMLDCSGN